MDQKKKSLRDRIGNTLLSVRTRYALMTAFFLLLAMAMFYACGRIVLMHFIRDAEQQMKAVGQSISTLAYRQAEQVQSAAMRTLNMRSAATADVRALLTDFGQPFSLVVELGGDGRFRAGAARKASTEPVETLVAEDFAEYAEVLSAWVVATRANARNAPRNAATGIVRVGGKLHYVVMLPRGGGCLMFGMPFAASAFSSQGVGRFGGFEIRVSERRSRTHPAQSRSAKKSYERSSYGIAPMLSEAMDFYSGGFWKLNENPLDAVFAIRDIAGNSISMVSVSLPKTFSGATRVAVGRLAVFVAVFGMFFVIPLFWAQNRMLMNPLSKMIQAIRELGERSADINCPRIEWRGKDEFAQLAESVNRMVETIAAKTVSLANVEASHQALIDGVPDALVIFDTKGRMVSVPKQPEGVGPLPGLFPGEVPAAGVFGEEPVRKFLSVLEETVRTPEMIGKARLKVQRPIGVPRSVPTRHFELRLKRLDERFVLAIVRDVSAEVAERKLRLAAEQRALDTSKRESLTGLAAGIAHDMNNVLSVVLNAAEAHDADPSGDSERALTAIRAAIRRGSAMMKELMAFAGENRMKLMRAKPQMMMEDLRQLAVCLVDSNIVLTIKSDPAAPDVDIDPNQFWKVLFNIVKNASEAIGPRPGHITLDAIPFEMTESEASGFTSEHPLASGFGAMFRIMDDGPGIPPDILGRLFDPYVSSKALGRGLGLATVRTIVEAHGGGIRVKSEPDHGTSFLIFLPTSKMAVSVEPDVPFAGRLELSGDVLVVDNDEAILKTTSILLKALKMTPHVAHNRREALATVRRHADRMRAIILDAHLGGIDTVRLLDAFRIGAPNIPVIVSSGSSKDEIAKMFGTHRYDAFLAKPYTIAELKASLSRPARSQEG